MALKSFFFLKNHKTRLAATIVRDTFELHQFVQHAGEITVFGRKNFKFWFKPRKNFSFAQVGKGLGVSSVYRYDV